jgi:hypothetical protein
MDVQKLYVADCSERSQRLAGREKTYKSHRVFTTGALSSWESEELDERPHALFLTAARKSLGSCELGDTVKARPKQFRYNL